MLNLFLNRRLKYRATKTKQLWITSFVSIFTLIIACNDPAADKYLKILQSHPTKLSQILPNNYLNLFQTKTKEKIKLISSLEHIGRDTVYNFLYDQKYYIALYTLSQSYNLSLQSSLRKSFNENSVEFGIPFYINNINSIGIRHRVYINATDVNSKPSDIFISFAGNEFSQSMKNDSIADYFLECKNLSIKYKVNGHQEFFVEADGYEPLEVTFIKREKKLYLIFVTIKGNALSLNRDIGLSLFK